VEKFKTKKTIIIIEDNHRRYIIVDIDKNIQMNIFFIFALCIRRKNCNCLLYFVLYFVLILLCIYYFIIIFYY